MNPYLELLKTDFREFCTDLYINQIHDIFTSAGFLKVEPTLCNSGQRRSFYTLSLAGGTIPSLFKPASISLNNLKSSSGKR